MWPSGSYYRVWRLTAGEESSDDSTDITVSSGASGDPPCATRSRRSRNGWSRRRTGPEDREISLNSVRAEPCPAGFLERRTPKGGDAALRRSRGCVFRRVEGCRGSCPGEVEGSVSEALINDVFQCFHQKLIVLFSAACDPQESFAILKRLAAIVPDQYPSIL